MVELKSEIKKLIEAINKSQTILISAHIHPDGDSMGSSYGLCHALLEMGKNVKVVKNDETPRYINFLEDESIIYNENFEKIDLFIAVDSSSVDRLGVNEKYLKEAEITALIDHHNTNTFYADINVVNKLSSACEVITHILLDNNINISEKTATYLFLGITTDTNRFLYESSNATTLKIGAKLEELGADKKLIYSNLYDKINPNKLFFQAEVIKNAQKIGDKIIIAKVNKEMTDKYDLEYSDSEDVVSILRSIEGIEVSALIKEFEENDQKLSLRSQEFVDVSKIALEFGGGGHVRASGATINESIDKAYDIVVKRLEKLYEDGSLGN